MLVSNWVVENPRPVHSHDLRRNRMTADNVPKWMREKDVRPKVVILCVPDRASVRTELKRLRPAIAEHADIVAEDLRF